MAIESHQIEGLELVRFLARGGSASVYEARDPRHSRKVAVKIFDQSDVEERRRRTFRREVQAMGRLDDHPNVLTVFDSGFTAEGAPYLVMPLISSGTIATRIVAHEVFSIEELLAIAVKLTSALATAHRRGILHCDIKPSNIFLGQFGDPMLGDLGISSVSDSGITTTNQVSMTLRYAAPEIINNREHTERTDLYSLGATLFAMIELAPPFSAKSSAALVGEIVGATKPPALTRDVPPELAALLSELMAIEPEDRPESALVVVDRLQQIQRSIGATITPAAVGTSDDDVYEADTLLHDRAETSAPAARERRSSSIKLGVGIAAALALVLAGLLAWWPTSGGNVETGAGADDEVAGVNQFASSDSEAPADDLATADDLEAPADELAPAVVIERSDDEAAAEMAEFEEPPLVWDDMTIVGSVSQAGQPVEALAVDLFVADEARPRGDFVGGFETQSDGRYGFEAPQGCYVLTFVAPAGSLIDGGGLHRDVEVCVEPDQVSEVDAVVVVAPVADTRFSGTVIDGRDASPAEGVHVDIFIASNDGIRADFIAETDTAADGTFSVELPTGCYIATIVAPEGRTLVGGDAFLNTSVLCADARTGAAIEAELN